MGTEFFMQTDGQSDMTKLTVAFCNFANAPKMEKPCRPALLTWQSYKPQVNRPQLTEQKLQYIKDSE